MKNNNDKEEVRFCNTYSINDFKTIDINSLSRNEDNGFELIIKSLKKIHLWLIEMLELIENNKINYKKEDKRRIYEQVSLICATFIKPIKELDYGTEKNKYSTKREKIIQRYCKYIRGNGSDPLIRLYMEITKDSDKGNFMKFRTQLIAALRNP